MLLALLLCAAPVFDTFDGPLDPGRWYVGVPSPPKRGVLRIPNALAQTQKARAALAALRKALGGDVGGASSDQLRAAAGRAARAILRKPPAEWPGFQFDPRNRFVTIQQGKELTR